MHFRYFFKSAITAVVCAALICSPAVSAAAAVPAATTGETGTESDSSFYKESSGSVTVITPDSADAVSLTMDSLPADSDTESQSASENSKSRTSDGSGTYYDQVTDQTTSGGYYIRKIAADNIASLQEALTEAKENATLALPYKIVVEPGAYELSKSLRIYSNTYLYMEGVTFTQKSGASSNMLRVGDVSDTMTGYYYQNITLYGGVWDENNNSNTAIKVAHTSSFTMINQTVQNTYNSHLMEVAGVKNFTVQGCTFQNQTLTADASTLTYEAIQLDVLVPGHFSGYAYEVLQNQQITIDGCTFNNVPRGVGSHTAILNCPMDYVKITNNTFSNTTSCAIQVRNCQNLTISGNKMTNVPRGIAVYTMRPSGTYLPSSISPGTLLSSSYLAPSTSQNIVITNNNISCSGSDMDSDYVDCGILVCGYNAVSPLSTTDGDILPTGNYYINGASVTGNTISAGCGIILENTQNSSVSSNTITFNGDTAKTCRGITLLDSCSNVTLSQNSVNLFPKTGIYIESSASVTVSKNSLTTAGNGIFLFGTKNSRITSNTLNCKSAPQSYGAVMLQQNSTDNQISSNQISDSLGTAISLLGSSSASAITGNIISSAGYCGIYVESASVTKINKNQLTNTCADSSTPFGAISVCSNGVVSSILKNTITSSQMYGIMVNGGEVKKIRANTISNTANYGIVVYNKANVTKIAKNTVTDGKTIGIHIANTSSAVSVTSNTVSNCKTAQIYVNRDAGSDTVTISKNTLTGASKIEGIRADSGTVTILTNKIKSCRYAILLNANVKATVYRNTYSNNKYNSTRIETTSFKNLSKPTSVKATAISKTSIQLSWKKVTNATGYRIYRSTKKNSGYKKIATVSAKKTTYTSKKLTANTKYYYKIVAYRKSANKNTVILSNESAVVSKKTLK